MRKNLKVAVLSYGFYFLTWKLLEEMDKLLLVTPQHQMSITYKLGK
jgi:hypothetical protein